MLIRNLLISSIALAACSFAALAQTTTKTTTITQNYTFPPVGVAGSETLQVNLANTASATIATLAAPAAPSCTGMVSVTSSAGITKNSPFTVAGGAIQSISLPFSNIGAAGGARTEVLVTVQHAIAIPSTVPCTLIFSLETYLTSTGETHVLLGNTSTNGVIPVLTGVLSPTPITGPGGVIGGN
jgi:hypothetical protein